MKTTSRTSINDFQVCPTEAFWKWHAFGTGVEGRRVPIPLHVGSCVHLGMEKMLETVLGDYRASSIALEAALSAIDGAVGEFDAILRERGLLIEGEGEEQFVIREQRELLRGLLYAWSLAGAPELLSRYVVMAVEMELAVEWLGGIIFQARPDAVLLSRESNELYIGSWKTKSEWNASAEAESRHDAQGVSEAYALESWITANWSPGEESENPLLHYINQQPSPPKVMGVHMEFLLKGKRKEVKDRVGERVQQTPLLRAWTRRGITPDEDEWAFSYWYTCTESHVKGVSKGGKPAMCEGFRLHRLTDDWIPIFVPDVCEVLDWIDKLDRGEVQKGQENPLPGMFISRDFYRNQQDMDSWVAQSQKQEQLRSEMFEELTFEEREGDLREWLSKEVTQHRHSCFRYGRKCEFYSVCWEGVWPFPGESGFFVARKPHHLAPGRGVEG